MPTYEFRCPDGTIIERVFKMSEVPDAIPSPKGDGLATRIISGGADLIFKGSGFYITDYGKDGKKDIRERSGSSTNGAKESKAVSTSDSSSSAKSESTKADTKSTASTPASKGESS